MLAGGLPFEASDVMELIDGHAAKRPIRPAERLKEIPDVDSAISMEPLTKTAQHRYQTAAVFARRNIHGILAHVVDGGHRPELENALAASVFLSFPRLPMFYCSCLPAPSTGESCRDQTGHREHSALDLIRPSQLASMVCKQATRHGVSYRYLFAPGRRRPRLLASIIEAMCRAIGAPT
jgi:hypothetical protein